MPAAALASKRSVPPSLPSAAKALLGGDTIVMPSRARPGINAASAFWGRMAVFPRGKRVDWPRYTQSTTAAWLEMIWVAGGLRTFAQSQKTTTSEAEQDSY